MRNWSAKCKRSWLNSRAFIYGEITHPGINHPQKMLSERGIYLRVTAYRWESTCIIYCVRAEARPPRTCGRNHVRDSATPCPNLSLINIRGAWWNARPCERRRTWNMSAYTWRRERTARRGVIFFDEEEKSRPLIKRRQKAFGAAQAVGQSGG